MDFQRIREKSIKLSKERIRDSVSEDDYVINAINNIEELAKVTNVLAKRLRQWYDLYMPEFSRKMADNEGFIKQVLEKDRKQLMKELKLDDSMGKNLDKKDLQPIISLAQKIKTLYELRDELKKYLETVMNKYCKNMTIITGALLGAKLIQEAGSVRRLALIPSSTIQMLGAEKALFRHLKTGAKPPKHGIILQHPLIANARKDIRGKHARMLADKISIAVKVDFFKGDFIGEKLKKELEAKLR